MNNENGIFNIIYNNINLVYKALVKTVRETPNFEMIGEEPAVHSVHALIGKSIFNQGDALTISLEPIDENKTKMHIVADEKVENLRVKYGDTIQKLFDKIQAILPPPKKEEPPKPNNLVQVGELSKQMELQANGGDPTHLAETPSVNQLLNQQTPNNDNMYANYSDSNNSVNNNTESNSGSAYAYEPKPFDYESLKENESSKHQGNDPLQDLMKNL